MIGLPCINIDQIKLVNPVEGGPIVIFTNKLSKIMVRYSPICESINTRKMWWKCSLITFGIEQEIAQIIPVESRLQEYGNGPHFLRYTTLARPIIEWANMNITLKFRVINMRCNQLDVPALALWLVLAEWWRFQHFQIVRIIILMRGNSRGI